MSRQEIDEFLSGRWVARLATIGGDGYPHVYPFWYYWDGECFYLTATRTRGSYRDLKLNPRCSVVVDMDDRPLMGMRSNMARACRFAGARQGFQHRHHRSGKRQQVSIAGLGFRYPPGACGQVDVHPSHREQFAAARPEHQREWKIGAPTPVGLFEQCGIDLLQFLGRQIALALSVP